MTPSTMQLWRRLATGTGAAALMATVLAGAPGAALAGDVVRATFDGAGPSHLFWLRADRSGAADLVGVVDPLFAAVRFYRIARGDQPLASRMTPLGACALPIAFRPWRLYQRDDRIVLESMPDPGRLGAGARARDLRTARYEIRRGFAADGQAALAAAQRLDTPGWDPERALACGKRQSGNGLATRAAPYRARRDPAASARAILLDNRDAALAPRGRLRVESDPAHARRLISADELEPARGVRAVLTAESVPSRDGILRIRQRILLYASGSREPVRAFAFESARLREKLAARPLAMMPTGELLVLGSDVTRGDRLPVRIQSCGIVLPGAALANPLCADALPEPPALAEAAAVRVAGLLPGVIDAAAIWANARPLAEYRLSVDASVLPEACRAPDGCALPDDTLRFVPIRGIRLTRGRFLRRGVPYAQAEVPRDLDRLLAAPPAQLARALAGATHGARGWPGNIADGVAGDLGIDCSGLIQVAWGDRAGRRLTTDRMQAFDSAITCPVRLPGPGWLAPGDALNINVAGTNHAVLFASAIRLDGASDAWLVLESSSGCDGVCWSVYDPSWFHGWGMYRAQGRRDVFLPATSPDARRAFPETTAGWLQLLRRPAR